MIHIKSLISLPLSHRIIKEYQADITMINYLNFDFHYTGLNKICNLVREAMIGLLISAYASPFSLMRLGTKPRWLSYFT